MKGKHKLILISTLLLAAASLLWITRRAINREGANYFLSCATRIISSANTVHISGKDIDSLFQRKTYRYFFFTYNPDTANALSSSLPDSTLIVCPGHSQAAPAKLGQSKLWMPESTIHIVLGDRKKNALYIIKGVKRSKGGKENSYELQIQ